MWVKTHNVIVSIVSILYKKHAGKFQKFTLQLRSKLKITDEENICRSAERLSAIIRVGRAHVLASVRPNIPIKVLGDV
jgi:hypothetical protein